MSYGGVVRVTLALELEVVAPGRLQS
eukprot:SAG25_NODE_12563_length_278_cov_0.581006_1_plen_25_part_01